jgi:putative ABC transport system permease protein
MMIRTRGRKVVRDILSRKGRTALVSTAILAGVFGVVCLVSAGDIFIRQLHKDIRTDALPMTRLYVTVPNASVQIDNQAALDAIRSLPNVTQVEGQANYSVSWKKPGDEQYINAYILSYSSSLPLEAVPLEPMRLIKGDWPEPGQHEIAVEKRLADQNGVKVGDMLVFRSSGGAATTEEWRVSGIVFHPYFVLGENGDIQPQDKIFALYEDAQKIVGFAGYDVLAVRYTDYGAAQSGLDLLKITVAQDTSYIPVWNWTENPKDYFAFTAVSNVVNVLNMLAVLAMVVSGFLVANVVNTIVIEQKQQIGILKSVGATRWDIFLIYAGVALAYGIIGLIPGVIIGAIAGGIMAENLAGTALTLVENFRISPVGVLSGVALGLVVPVLAAVFPVLSATRISIRSAITDLGISSTWGKGRMSRVISALPLPIHFQQALRNVAQKRLRLALTVVTLMLAAASFMGVYALFTTLADEIRAAFDTINFQTVVSLSEPRDFKELQDALSGVQGIRAVYPAAEFEVGLEGYKSTDDFSKGAPTIYVDGVDTSSDAWKINYASGTGWNGAPDREGVVLTSAVADQLKKKVGDKLRLTANGKAAEFEIIGIFEFPGEMLLMRWQDLAGLAGFVDAAGNPLANSLDIQMSAQDPTSRQVDENISAVTDALSARGIGANYDNQVESREQNIQQIRIFNSVFQITSGVMAAVGAIGLLAALSMAVFERQKEIGVMRSIGAGSSAVAAQFLAEGILVGVVAWIVAVPLGYWIGKGLGDALSFYSGFHYTYSLSVILLGLGGMIAIATVASLWPSLAAARKTVSNILRYQ